MRTPLFTVDAFAERPFSGNPAAVCLLERPASVGWMSKVAREMNLSETAFLTPAEGDLGLRWFTPRVEVDLCGHATLAAAHVLWESGRVARDERIRFSTRSGILVAEPAEEGIRLDLPSDPPVETNAPEGLGEALGVEFEWFGRGRSYELARIGSESGLRALLPDFRRLAALIPVGLCVTAVAGQGAFDFVSRFFAPSAGVDEDPVTGSAHCLLAPYWGTILGKRDMRAHQASERGGDVRVVWSGDRVAIEGRAVTVSRGEIRVPDEAG